MKAAERQKDHQRLLNNLKLIQKNYNVSELSDLLGISKPTWIAKMKEPWRKLYTMRHQHHIYVRNAEKRELHRVLKVEICLN